MTLATERYDRLKLNLIKFKATYHDHFGIDSIQFLPGGTCINIDNHLEHMERTLEHALYEVQLEEMTCGKLDNPLDMHDLALIMDRM